MRKIYLLCVLLAISFGVYAQPTVLGTQLVDGNYSTYDLTARGLTSIVRLQATSSTATGNRNWEFATGTSASTNYSTNWRPYSAGQTLSGFDTKIDPASETASARYNTSFGGQSGLLPAIAANNYYTIIVGVNPFANNFMSVIETDFDPVSIDAVSFSGAFIGSDVTVSITTSASPNVSEEIWVRYSDDNFASSSFVKASGAGTSYTASIPEELGNTINFYVLTTKSSITLTHADADYQTLELNNNGGLNYSYFQDTYGNKANGVDNCSGVWSDNNCWYNGTVPPVSSPLELVQDVQLDQDATVSSVTINSGATFTGSDATARTLTIADGGSFTNNGTFTATANSTVSFAGAGTISGTSTFNNVDVSGGVDFGSNSTIDGTFTINAGGFAQTNAPIYGASSTLIFSTGGPYAINNATTLWTTGASLGQGVPFNVTVATSNLTISESRDVTGSLTVQSGATLSTSGGADLLIDNNLTNVGTFNQDGLVDVGGNFTNQSDYNNISDDSGIGGALGELLIVRGDFDNQSSSTFDLSSQIGGDLEVKGNFTDNGTFNSNSRAVFFTGSSTQTVSSTAPLTIDYMIIDNSNGVQMLQNLNLPNNLTLTKGNLDLNGNTLTIAGDIRPNTGNGTIDADATGSTLNLNSAVARTIETGDIQNNEISNLTISGTGIVTSNVNLTILESSVVNSGATLTIASGNELIIPNGSSITATGTVNIEDASSLLITGTGTSTGNGYNVTRNTTNLADNTQYNFWSSPVSGETLGDVFTGTNSSDFYSHDGSGWSSSLATSTVMVAGVGYTATGPESGTYPNEFARTFSGTSVNNGPVSVGSLSGTYALLGNPYPSAINATTFLTDNNFNAIYLWDNYGTGATSNSGYASFNGTTGTISSTGRPTPTNQIASCQGFFVDLNGGTSASFTNSMRMSSSNDEFFSPLASQKVLSWINVTNDNNDFNQIAIGLLDQATDDYDPIYDAKKFNDNPNLSFYSKLNGEDFVIQGLSKVSFNAEKIIELGINAGVTGEYTIALDSLDNWPGNYSLVLVDTQEGIEVNLLTDTAYVFEVTQAGAIAQRFYLNIERIVDENNGSNGDDPFADPSTSVEDLAQELNQVKVYQAQDLLWVDVVNSQLAWEQAQLLTLTGQQMDVIQMNRGNARESFTTSGLSTGVYLVQLTAEDGTQHHHKVRVQ